MKVLQEYSTHHYFRDYEKTLLYCPTCGSRSVWQEQGDGDYYQGVEYICTACNSVHHLDNSNNDPDIINKNIVKQILSKKIDTPTTLLGG